MPDSGPDSGPRSSGEVTRLLSALGRGDAAAADRLFPLIHDELRAIAERQMRGQRRGHTLEATALVNEAYLRLVGGPGAAWESRTHYLNVAARAMRSVLVDHARRRSAAKRGGAWSVARLDDGAVIDGDGPTLDFIALDAALKRFAETYPDKVRVVELRFFAGLSVDETARVMETSPSTVKRDWRLAKAWLKREMGGDDQEDAGAQEPLPQGEVGERSEPGEGESTDAPGDEDAR